MIRYVLCFIATTFCFSALAETVTIKLSSGSLSIRDQASSSAKSCAKVKSDEKYEKVAEENGWFQIKVNKPGCSDTAWVYGYYTEKYYKGSEKMSYLQKHWAPTPQHEVAPQSGSTIIDASGDTSYNTSAIIPASEPAVTGASGEIATPDEIYNVIPTARPKDLEVTPSGLTLNDSKLSAADFEVCKFKMSDRNELDSTRTKNCWELMKKANKGEIPKEALVYTLKYLKANLGRLKDSSCLGKGPKGINNSCQFMMNDMNKRVKGFTHRSPAYFIDLCHAGAGSAQKGLVVKTYVNRGTGSAGNKYTDLSKRRTTVVGAFLTGDISPFIPYSITSSYNKIGWKKCFKRNSKGNLIRDRKGNYIPVANVKRDCPVLRLGLYGAHSSNNSSEASKPMHTSPYKSSIGCPSVGQKDNWMMLELNKRGPSLVMNYGPKKHHTDLSINQCKND